MDYKPKRKRIPYVPHNLKEKPVVEVKSSYVPVNPKQAIGRTERKEPTFIRPDEKEIKKIIRELIREEAREEAFLILSKASDGQVKEFMTYYREGKDVVCPMVLDAIKIRLVKDGEMKMGTEDWFGKPMWEDENEKAN